MELKGCDAAAATRLTEELEERGLTTKECYGLLQDWLGGRRLVDKTPSYALDPSALEKAEADFESALYIHLVRHPFGKRAASRASRSSFPDAGAHWASTATSSLETHTGS